MAGKLNQTQLNNTNFKIFVNNLEDKRGINEAEAKIYKVQSVWIKWSMINVAILRIKFRFYHNLHFSDPKMLKLKIKLKTLEITKKSFKKQETPSTKN